MSALTVTLGVDISSLRGAMAAATRLVGDSAKRMANISLIGIKAGLGAALAGGASALAGQFGVSDSQVKKLIESGQVGFPAIEQAFIDMTSQGGKFAGMMEAQSKK